jgi:hypothetical protein
MVPAAGHSSNPRGLRPDVLTAPPARATSAAFFMGEDAMSRSDRAAQGSSRVVVAFAMLFELEGGSVPSCPAGRRTSWCSERI